MKILFDQGTPVPLRRHLGEHARRPPPEMGWSRLTNGELLAAATEAGFEALVTTDQHLRYQQNLKDRTIAVVVLMSASWPRIAQQTERVVDAIKALGTGDYIEVEI